MTENLKLRLAAAKVPSTIRTLQADRALESKDLTIAITPAIPRGRTVLVSANAYLAAMADAHAKAETIARGLRAPLGAPTSVAELTPNDAGGYTSAEQPPPVAMTVEHAVVRAPSQGVVLAVHYVAGGIPISVFGFGATPRQPGIADADGIFVSLQGHGKTLEQASTNLRAAEKSVRAIAHRVGAVVTVTDASARSY